MNKNQVSGSDTTGGCGMRGAGWHLCSKIRPYRILRDVILVKLFAFICGGLADYTASAAVGQNFSMVISGIIGTLIMMSIGLSIVGAINPKNRWFHLAIVTALLFAVSCLTSGFISLTNALCFLGFYVVGGLLSMLYPVFRNREVETVDEQTKKKNEVNYAGGAF